MSKMLFAIHASLGAWQAVKSLHISITAIKRTSLSEYGSVSTSSRLS
jgi:hypothetical protein